MNTYQCAGCLLGDSYTLSSLNLFPCIPSSSYFKSMGPERGLIGILLLTNVQVGLWMMVRAMRDRNYLEANDVYLLTRLRSSALTGILLLLIRMQVGLWMMVRAMRDRNYLEANDVYLRLAIGTAPWPIGVTSVGIHERSAREKISHVMNTSGQAHIMNDEATRKYFQVGF